MPWNGCRQYQVTMMLTAVAALRSRLARKAVFSHTRWGQQGSVISPGTMPQLPAIDARCLAYFGPSSSPFSAMKSASVLAISRFA